MKNQKICGLIASGLMFISNIPSSVAETVTIKYGYDELGRIKTVDTDGTRLSRIAYDYDAADNRTKKVSTISIPFDAISISDMGVSVTTPNVLDGTARFKLKSDGNIEITRTTSFNYAGSSTPVYYNEVAIIGRWFAEGYNALDFLFNATLASSHGYSPCTEGHFGKGLPGHYDLSWAMSYPAPGTSRKGCRVYLEIVERENPYVVLGSAFITISAGPVN